MSCADPSTVAHCQPARAVTVVGVGAQVGQLAGTADGDQCDDRLIGQRMGQNSGVDDRRLGAAIATQRGEYNEALVFGGELSEGWQIGHGWDSFRSGCAFQPRIVSFHSRSAESAAVQSYSYSTITDGVSGTAWQVRM